MDAWREVGEGTPRMACHDGDGRAGASNGGVAEIRGRIGRMRQSQLPPMRMIHLEGHVRAGPVALVASPSGPYE